MIGPMPTDKPAALHNTLSLKPKAARAAAAPADARAPRRGPVRPPGPARARSVSDTLAARASLSPPPARAPQPVREPAARRATARPGAATPGAPRPAAGEGERLNKRMAELGLCSRREADAWIERGWVRVDGQLAVVGQLVAPGARIDVAEPARQRQGEQVTILLHKPVGYVSGQPEDGHEAAATLIGPRSQWRGDARTPADGRRFRPEHTRGLAPAGRLDIDSTGLLVLTQDGRVARTLIGEDSAVEKEYLVRVHYAPNGPQGAGVVAQNVQAAFPAERLARLRHGLSLDGQPLKPAQVDWQNPEQLRFVLTEGKKRQIRRMCEQVGLHVVGLKRIRIGRVVLGHLPLGQWRFLGPGERF